MNLESINKWLDNEYGVSYTRLEELHDFLIEQNMKYQDKIEELQQEKKQLKEDKKKVWEWVIYKQQYSIEPVISTDELDDILEILGDKE